MKDYKSLRESLKVKFFASVRMHACFEKDYKKTDLNRQDTFEVEFGHRLAQLEFSFERLLMFPTLITSYNPTLERKGFSRAAQFTFHIENYFSSVYIFDQRNKKLIGFVEKFALKKLCKQTNIDKLRKKRRIISEALNSLIYIRGDHVHNRNYQDQDFYRLELYDTVGSMEPSLKKKKLYYAERDDQLRHLRTKWKKAIAANNDSCKELMGMLYQAIDPLEEEIYNKLAV